MLVIDKKHSIISLCDKLRDPVTLWVGYPVPICNLMWVLDIEMVI